jgi:hypothetical protein
MPFGYPSLYSNGVNSNTQLRRSVDMVYQRGGTYEILLTGTSLEQSMQMDVDLYNNDVKVGRMSLVPYSINTSGGIINYKFNLRPYDYMSNYVQTAHYSTYILNSWTGTSTQNNINNPYPNIIKANFKYGYRYVNSTGGTVTEYTINGPSNNLNHFTPIGYSVDETIFRPSGFTNTGQYFDYVGGQFQMADNKYILPNYDQEIGTTIGTGVTITSDIYRRLSPMSTYMMDYPTLPEQSETSRFLTDSPRIQYIQSDENYVLWYLNGQSGDRQVIEADYAVINLYNSSNTKITGYTQQLNFSGTTYASPLTGYTDTLKVFSLPCGPVDITNIINSGQTWDSVAYYTVQLYYSHLTNTTSRVSVGPVGPLSERFYFYLYENCKPENTRIAFLNQRGGYDYYTFTAYRQNSQKISSQSYDSRYYSTDLSTPDRDFGRTLKTFATDVSQDLVLETDYISVPTGQWLEQLFTSPQVYEMKPDYVSPINSPNTIYKDLRPLQILSTEVDTITKKHKKLNKYRITFKSADTFFANRGF